MTETLISKICKVRQENDELGLTVPTGLWYANDQL